jgi:xylitol oxidase
MKNWAGNLTFGGRDVHEPRTVEQVRQIILRGAKVKALGTRHSFNDIADSTGGQLISMRHFDRITALETRSDRPTVTVDAGITYGQLCQYLHGQGFALHNLASLPHISVAGACATATHGSGDRNGNLATAVSAIEMVTGGGDVISLSREQHREQFHGTVVSLGALGIVTKLTLDVVPAYRMCQDVYENLPLRTLAERFEQVFALAYSVSLFTDWRTDRINQLWIKRRIGDGDTIDLQAQLGGATPATRHMHPLPGCPPDNCTEQLGVAGPWHQRLPHFRMEFTPSAGEELQSEYFVPRGRALEAMDAINSMRHEVCPLLQVSEIRSIAADELWMSPCYRRASLGIHFTWQKDERAVLGLLPKVERKLEPFAARPHWGKLFTVEPARLRSLYPRFAEFRRLLESYDPVGRFHNTYLDRCILR